MSSPRVCPIEAGDTSEVARFLHEHLNSRLSPEGWAQAVEPPWRAPGSSRGLCLRDGDALVGVYLAFCSDRTIGGERLRFCNLAAWCVLDEYRSSGLKLLMGLLRTDADVFTDLSPSGAVVPIDERLGFRHLDTATSLRVNLPGPTRRGGVELVTDPARIATLLDGDDARVYRDHAGSAAARHVVAVVDGQACYVIWRRVTRKRLPVFASLVHVGEPALLGRALGPLGAHLLARGAPVLLAEHRIAGGPLRGARVIAGRPKLFRGDRVGPDDVDDLYSEIACVPW